MTSRIGVYGLAVMGQNLALNIAQHLAPLQQSVAVCNRSHAKVDETVARAAAEGDLPLRGYKDVRAAAGCSAAARRGAARRGVVQYRGGSRARFHVVSSRRL
jgi:6-phosphogluconate dehydrogenase